MRSLIYLMILSFLTCCNSTFAKGVNYGKQNSNIDVSLVQPKCSIMCLSNCTEDVKCNASAPEDILYSKEEKK